jgi:hypothetical protein
MSEMIERVAKTIFLKNNPELNWDDYRLQFPRLAYKRVRDVIEAMREPTEAMMEAGIMASRIWCCGVADIWEKMIDAALADAPVRGEGEDV